MQSLSSRVEIVCEINWDSMGMDLLFGEPHNSLQQNRLPDSSDIIVILYTYLANG